MRKRNNKTCICCGKIYTFCNSCAEFDNLPRWMAIYHDENCKKIFEAASDFLANCITKKEAKSKFNSCDLSNKSTFNKKVIEAIDKAYEVEVSKNEVPTSNKKNSTKSTYKYK